MSKITEKIKDSERNKNKKNINFRATDEDYEEFAKKCERLGLGVSETMRYLMKNFKG